MGDGEAALQLYIRAGLVDKKESRKKKMMFVERKALIAKAKGKMRDGEGEKARRERGRQSRKEEVGKGGGEGMGERMVKWRQLASSGSEAKDV